MPTRLYEKYISGEGTNSGRIVLHSDMNNFFASVECMLNPSLAAYPVAVCGSEEDRHGIVLAKNYKAKAYGIKTAEPVRAAKAKCPKLVVVSPHYDLYMEYSRKARKIYSGYTDRVEPFGADEAWLEMTNCPGVKTLADGVRTADEIRNRIKSELGLTVSVGISDNKAFAKLASDYKKPDATTLLAPENYAEKILPLDISELIFAGPSTVRELNRFGLHSFYDVVRSDRSFLKSVLGIHGEQLLMSASGFDSSPVMTEDAFIPIKSIGNSFTPPRDLVCDEDVCVMLCLLSESVGERLRSHGLKCTALQLHVRGSDLKILEKQTQLKRPTDCTQVIYESSLALFQRSFKAFLQNGIRSLGIRGISLTDMKDGLQLSMFDTDNDRLDRLSRLDSTIDGIRHRYGKNSLKRGIMMTDTSPLVKRGMQDETTLRSAFGSVD